MLLFHWKVLHVAVLALLSFMQVELGDGARTTDSLVLTNFNQTFKIQDEVYQFRLVPTFKVCYILTYLPPSFGNVTKDPLNCH